MLITKPHKSLGYVRVIQLTRIIHLFDSLLQHRSHCHVFEEDLLVFEESFVVDFYRVGYLLIQS